jgi:hypothetical protein
MSRVFRNVSVQGVSFHQHKSVGSKGSSVSMFMVTDNTFCSWYVFVETGPTDSLPWLFGSHSLLVHICKGTW